MIDINRKVG